MMRQTFLALAAAFAGLLIICASQFSAISAGTKLEGISNHIFAFSYAEPGTIPAGSDGLLFIHTVPIENPANWPLVRTTLEMIEMDDLNPGHVHVLAEGLRASWSSDGRMIVFEGQGGGGDLSTMDYLGGNRQQIIDSGGNDEMPNWSPDGAKIVYRSNVTGRYEIYVAEADGTNPENVSNMDAHCFNPAYSPDGSKIAFSCAPNLNSEIFVVNEDGSDLRNLSTHEAADHFFAWSPDGSRLAFDSRRTGDYEIYVVDVDGEGLVRITDNPAPDHVETWTPDGSALIFTSMRTGGYDLYMVDLESGDLVQLTDSPWTDSGVIWLNDADTIAYTTVIGNDAAIVAFNIETFASRQLTDLEGGERAIAYRSGLEFKHFYLPTIAHR